MTVTTVGTDMSHRRGTTFALIAVATTATISFAGAASATAPSSVGTRSTKLGTFLVDAKGRTLYLFEKDSKNVSKCSGECAEVWPPDLVSGSAHVSGKAEKSLIGTIKRSDGTHQLTYRGHPLYTYVGDRSAGTTVGQGVKEFGANWYVVTPTGSKIDDD